MLLGVLINYGLRYNYQQQLVQDNFRRAMATASFTNTLNFLEDRFPIFENFPFNLLVSFFPTSISHATIRSKHIPDPANPWGVGQVVPLEAHAQVTRNSKMYYTPDWAPELPEVRINIDNREVSYKTAGFRIGIGSKEKFEQVFGTGNVGPMHIPGFLPGAGGINNFLSNLNINIPVVGLNFGVYLITDPVAGQIFDYDSAIRECRDMLLPEACFQQCSEGSSVTQAILTGIINIGEITSHLGEIFNALGSECLTCIIQGPGGIVFPPPNFCTNLAQDPQTGRWHTDELERLFQNVAFYAPASKSLGLQPRYTQTTKIDNRLVKEENPARILTKDEVDWKQMTSREIIYNRGYNEILGTTFQHQPGERSIEKSIRQERTYEWRTKK